MNKKGIYKMKQTYCKCVFNNFYSALLKDHYVTTINMKISMYKVLTKDWLADYKKNPKHENRIKENKKIYL